MAGEKTEFHQAPRHILGKVKPIQCPGFTLLQVGQGSGSNWVIFPIRVLLDTQLHRGISIQTILKQVKFPPASLRLVL